MKMKCYQCNKKISTSCTFCPFCGAEKPNRANFAELIDATLKQMREDLNLLYAELEKDIGLEGIIASSLYTKFDLRGHTIRLSAYHNDETIVFTVCPRYSSFEDYLPHSYKDLGRPYSIYSMRNYIDLDRFLFCKQHWNKIMSKARKVFKKNTKKLQKQLGG